MTLSRSSSKKIPVAEELGDLDEEARRQAGVLLGVALDVVDVVPELRRAGRDHPALQAPENGRPLVAREVDTAPLAQLVQERAQEALVVRPRRLVHARREIVQERPDRLELRDDVDRGG